MRRCWLVFGRRLSGKAADGHAPPSRMQWCFPKAHTIMGTQAAWDLRRRRRSGGLFLFLVAPALLLALGLLLTLAIHSVLLFLRDSRLLSEGEWHRFARSLASRCLARGAEVTQRLRKRRAVAGSGSVRRLHPRARQQHRAVAERFLACGGVWQTDGSTRGAPQKSAPVTHSAWPSR